MRIRLQGSGHATGLLSELNRCRLSRLFCDVIVQVGSHSFAAHRAVLACAGTHFRSLFSGRGNQVATSGATATYSLDFVSPANFEKVLTFVYTGEIFTDLIDVGVLYELAERLGLRELVKACHATFPDLHHGGPASTDCVADGDLDLDVVAAVAAGSSACSSSAASCSSLSSSAGPSAAPTPVTAPSPFPQGTRGARPGRAGGHAAPVSLTVSLKAEDTQSHLGYGQMAEDKQLQSAVGQSSAGVSTVAVGAPPRSPLQLKTEEGVEVVVGVGELNGQEEPMLVTGSRAGSLPPCVSDACSFPDSSAQLGVEGCGLEPPCAPSSSSGDPLDSLQMDGVEGGVTGVIYGGEEVDEDDEDHDKDGEDGAAQWRHLAGEIIELSDDENYMEEEDEEEEDEDEDLVCVENGAGGGGANPGQAPPAQGTAACKACGTLLSADPAALRAHAESHVTDTGACRVCEASFPGDRRACVSHALSHVAFSCDMCDLQFATQAKLVRHRRQAAARYAPPGPTHSATQWINGERPCAVCNKTLAKDFQVVRDHLLSHVCVQSLSCGVCQLPQPSLCALLWHALTHLSLPVYSCPLCAGGFLDRPLLDRHMALHADDAGTDREATRAHKVAGPDGKEELRCFLCPQSFRSASAFQNHLSFHTETQGPGSQGWAGKRKADQMEYPSSCSSSSPLESGSLGKLGNVGFGLGVGSFSLSDKLLQGAVAAGFSTGLLPNGNSPSVGGSTAGAPIPREKWYRCRFCGKHFAHSGEFTYHLRIHTGEKPYQCKVCLRFFRGRSTIICHLKTHAGALMYRCTVCGLYFSTLKLVSSHMEVHKDHLPPDFNIEQTFMYNDHSKEPLPSLDT
ncbi:zinc finger and BTB domain-containing protein 39 [Esox lucius]|uniref:Zinc finger and BTB domain containing 39 n=1 Tax=Esox lucius TaxID=8010 RepID=A0A3P8ZNW2_ESOLU|nr:zinc finger and BTB domain-containing protein 39 [Esox lucius]XP_019906970.1 zinc finger and BTB domain-containing protein 39 [Esox lucius]